MVPEHGPVEDPTWNVQEWKQRVLERLQVDESINPASREAIRSYVQLQVDTPEFRLPALDLARCKRLH
ncbi:hypothetical protein [Edaphobacter aggregans]|uniref:hypothetical protein n=1 Tax=Edaphobacter aggregans TaxID=570835 RepID=UPI00054FE086|nr:hypothetical protein [Edaphobacter aggregans]